MRIDFIGNSHLGTVAPELSRHKGDRDVAHYISRTYGSVTPSLVRGGERRALDYIKLEESLPYGAEIDLDRTDAVVCVGLNWSIVQMVNLWKYFRPVDARGDYAVPALSEPVWDAYVDAAFDSTHMSRLVSELLDLGEERIAVVPQPSPAEWVSSREGVRFAIYGEMTRVGDWTRVLEDFARQLDRLEKRGAHVFRQPAQTLTQVGFTKDRFAMGNVADQSEGSFYARGDFYHMNRDYARETSPDLFDWLDRRVIE